MTQPQEPAPSVNIRKAALSLGAIVFFMVAGTIAIHRVEGFSYVDSFYATTMVATGQGLVSPLTPSTNTGKILISVMAILSVGFILVAFSYLFGTFFGNVLKSASAGRTEKKIR